MCSVPFASFTQSIKPQEPQVAELVPAFMVFIFASDIVAPVREFGLWMGKGHRAPLEINWSFKSIQLYVIHYSAIGWLSDVNKLAYQGIVAGPPIA